MAGAFPQLQMSTLLIWGEDDLVFPKTQAEAAVKQLREGDLKVSPDCGPMPHWEQPDPFVIALDEFSSNIVWIICESDRP